MAISSPARQANLLADLAALSPEELAGVAKLIAQLHPDAVKSAPADTTTTLGQFYDTFGEPILLRQRRKADPKTIAGYRKSVEYWRTITGDPPLCQISDDTLAEFVAGLEALPGRKAVSMNGYTIHKHARHVQMLLYRAGPRRPGVKHCQNLIADVPQFGTIEKPQAECEGDFTPAELAAMWSVAPLMNVPTGIGATPGEFWRGFLAVGFYGMYRVQSLMTLAMADVDASGWVTVRNENAKRRRGYRNFLPAFAMRAIAWGDPRRTLVFPGVNLKCMHGFRKRFNRLQMLAGIARHECRGFHGLRKAGLTALAKLDPIAARMQAGHAAATILEGHYLSRNQMLAEAVDKMPSPFGEVAT